MKLVNSLPIIEKLKLWDRKTNGFINFILWAKQKIMLTALHAYLRIIVLKKRQVGGSQLVGADSLVQCMFQMNFVVLILSKTGDDAKDFLDRIRAMYGMLPEDIKKINPVTKGLEGGDEMVFASGSKLVSLPANKGRGRTASRVIIDEGAFITKRDSHTTLTEVLRSVVATIEKAGGQVIIISTANGPNKFKKMFIQATNKMSSYVSIFFSCWDDPTFTKKDRQQIIEDYGEDHTNQEYPRTWREAFLSTGSPRFDLKTLEWYKEHRILPILLAGEITENGLEQNSKGHISFFAKKKVDGQYFITADIAEGLEHGDYSVAKVFDLETWDQVAEWHGHEEPAEFGSTLARMGRHYNNAIIAPERNKDGVSSITQLKNVEDYPEELIFQSNYTKEKPDDDFKTPQKRYGWLTTSLTKKQMVNNFAHYLLKKLVPGLSEEDIGECMVYVKGKDGSTNAEPGLLDDRVIALCIAYYLLNMHDPKKREEWQNCGSCQHKKDNMTCKKSGRTVVKESFCSLWREWQPDKSLEREMNKAKGKRHHVGHYTGMKKRF